MPLPTARTPAITDLGSLTILLHGRPKGGKSTWASKAPDALFIATEPGLNHLDVYQKPVASWAFLLETCRELTEPGHSFRTVVLDTADNAFLMCREHVCSKLGIADPADAPFGKGFAAVNGEWHRVLTKLASLPLGLILISHSREKEVETRTGKITRWTPTMPERAAEIAMSLCDVIAFVDIESEKNAEGVTSEKRVLRCSPTTTWDAGDRTGKLLPTMPLDFAAFSEAIAAPRKP